MTHRHVPVVSMALLALLASTSGCTSALKQAFNEARGARAKLLFVQPVGDTALAHYQGVRFAPPTTTLGEELCPPELRAAYDGAAQELTVALTELYPGGEPALRVDSEVLYFQEKGILSGAEFLARVKMREGERVVVDAVVRAESKAFRAGGEKALARAAIDALGKFLRTQKGVKEEAEKEKGKEKNKERKKRE